MLQRQVRTVISLTAAKYKPLIFSLSGVALPDVVNIFFSRFLCYFCLLPAVFCHTYVRVEIRGQMQTGVHLDSFPMVRKTLFYKSWAYEKQLPAFNFQSEQA
jgi:hypothetical protein